MNLQSLSKTDAVTIGQCLRAAADGPFFPDWEFQTLFGLSRDDVRCVAEAWPRVDLSSEVVKLAVNNSLNNLLGYPHGESVAWPEWINAHREEVGDIFSRLFNE